MYLIASFRVDIPDNPEAETALRRLLMHHLARAELAQAIKQSLPPEMAVEVKITGTKADTNPKEQRRK